MFVFDKEKTLVSFKTKPNKVVVLLSTTHDQAEINNVTKKPDIIEFYNSTKVVLTHWIRCVVITHVAVKLNVGRYVFSMVFSI